MTAKTAGERRDALLASLSDAYDVVVVGGGITGAGVAREARRLGLSVLLVEQGDFASGTSSRSSKLVHGGLRYLKEGNLHLTWESSRERDRLLAEAPGLVDPIGFLLATYRGESPSRATYATGLLVYDLLSRGARHRAHGADDFAMLATHVARERLLGGFSYHDAQTDDARLVLRVLLEAEAAGASVLNYTRVEELLHGRNGVCGVVLRDVPTGGTRRVGARAVVNATGAWADRLRAEQGGRPMIRPLRGSHLVFPAWRLPVSQAVAFNHPGDGRPLFAFPWEGMTLLGTTDLDHRGGLDEEPSIDPAEVSYLVAGARSAFPALGVRASDAVASFSGVRPVVGTGKAKPSEESREHVLLDEGGLVTVTGGKLTTFRRIALDVVRVLQKRLRLAGEVSGDERALDTAPAPPSPLPLAETRRLAGRLGARAAEMLRLAPPATLARVGATPALWAELAWAAANEHVVRLDDLLLRRVRLGLLLADGAADALPRVRALCQQPLGWSNLRWEMEEAAYLERWRTRYRVPSEPALALACA